MKQKAQKEYLSGIKQVLETRFGRLTWDQFAVRAGIEPRTLKTYRMPESSADYRAMPQLARQAIEALMAQPMSVRTDVNTLVAALSSLVLSQAKIAVVDRQIISGLDWRPGARNGLSVEDRKIMALVSRFSLESGLKDFGGEVHELLFNCTQPLQDWLKIPALLSAGYGPTVLIDPDYGIPTPEAQELASEFSTITAHLEERLFMALKESLSKYPSTSADDYYRSIREFIVRNPVVSPDKLFQASKLIPGALWMAIQQEYYEPIPFALANAGKVSLCAYCNSLMRPTTSGGQTLRCQTRACHLTRPAKTGMELPVLDARRVKKGIHQYWVEPGLDEIRLYDAMLAAGLKAELYPFQDRVDIAIGDIGIDLKTYVSPEILGSKFKRGIGGLTHYSKKWLVVPDWLVNSSSDYMTRLQDAMGESARRVKCLSLSAALRIVKEEHHA